MHNVQLDTMDQDYTIAAANAAGLSAKVVKPEGPNNWPIVQVDGSTEQLQQFMTDQGYELDANPIA